MSNEAMEPRVKLFEGEKWLVITGFVGFFLSMVIACIIFFQGAIILPEGNLKDAFSFNAAIGIFILSVAAILPLANLGVRKRKVIRWFFIGASLYSYAIETIQNFRGYNPRFSREGSIIDMVGGMLFGVASIILVIIAILLTIQFFKIKPPFNRPLLIIGIRYAFISILFANFAGVWMILLQDRFTGDMGNIIILHGIGFHALQTLTFPAWLLEKVQIDERLKKWFIHCCSLCWTLSIILITIQTALGKTVFEWSALPIFCGVLLLVWLCLVMAAFFYFIKRSTRSFQMC